MEPVNVPSNRNQMTPKRKMIPHRTLFGVLFLVLFLVETAHSFAVRLAGRSRHTALGVKRNPFRALKGLFRKPKIEANFPLNGKKIKLSVEKAEELSRKYEAIDDVGERAFNILLDLELVTISKEPTKEL
jgi:hypothetical protein